MAEMKIVGDGQVIIRLERRLAPEVQFQLRRILPTPPKDCEITPCRYEGYCAYRITFDKFSEGVRRYLVSVALDIGDWSGETMRGTGSTIDALKAA